MADAINSAARIFQIAEEPAVRALTPVIEGYKDRMEPLAYDCIGCRKCWGADATRMLAEGFGDLETEGCGYCAAASDPPVVRLQDLSERPWPPYPGEYLLGNLLREQVEVVNLVGVTDIEFILQAVRECGSRAVPPLSDCAADAPAFERIQARAPKRLKLDPAGFFILLPQFEKGMIICEHYTSDGRLTHVIEGRRASFIAATAVERGLISQLDHAAYLGRELAKAEIELATGAVYEQDAALGSLPPEAAANPEESSCSPLPQMAT